MYKYSYIYTVYNMCIYIYPRVITHGLLDNSRLTPGSRATWSTSADSIPVDA